jgi:tetratricopeptide (TPR) repeat protein
MIKINLRWIELAVLVGLMLLYGWTTYQRNFVWGDDITLWSDCTRKSPSKHRPYNNLAVAFNEKNLPDEAISEAVIALKLRPDSPNPFVSIGTAYIEKGFFDTAVMFFKKALSIKPDYADPYVGMGNAYVKKGEMDSAINTYKKAIELNPDDINSRVNLGAAYGSKGLVARAIEEFQHTLILKPDSSDIYYNLGAAYEQLARSRDTRAVGNEQDNLIKTAIGYYEEALRINPADIQAKERMMKLRAKGN